MYDTYDICDLIECNAMQIDAQHNVHLIKGIPTTEIGRTLKDEFRIIKHKDFDVGNFYSIDKVIEYNGNVVGFRIASKYDRYYTILKETAIILSMLGQLDNCSLDKTQNGEFDKYTISQESRFIDSTPIYKIVYGETGTNFYLAQDKQDDEAPVIVTGITADIEYLIS